MVEDHMVEYTVRQVGRTQERRGTTTIFSGEAEVGKILRGDNSSYILQDLKNHVELILDPKVGGEISPFSLTVRRLKAGGGVGSRSLADVGEKHEQNEAMTLVVRDHLFQHKGKFYMFASVPEGKHPKELHEGQRFICRLDNFPFEDISQVDSATFSRLRRLFRGVIVGELGGFGSEGHRVRFAEELSDVALPLAALSYLLYSTA
jgi:hypothetical protein